MQSRLIVTCMFFLCLVLLPVVPALAQSSMESSALIPSAEAIKPISSEVIVPTSVETRAIVSSEAGRLISPEAQSGISAEAGKPVARGLTPEASTTASTETTPPAEPPLEEGASYKGVPWGADFNRFKEIKKYSGQLGSPSAAFINSAEDNNIALILDVPISNKGKKNEQRVMFEFVPQHFSSVYYEPDDVYYIFYKGQLAMAYSRIAEKNFDVYRDNFYKKYTENETLTKQYTPAAKKSYRLDAITFSKGKTSAFLVRCQSTEKQKTSSSAKVLFVSTEFYEKICKDIKDKIADQKRSKSEKEQELLQKDLLKIE